MARWQCFRETDPDLATLGQTLLEKFGMAYLATVRRDGSPRVHPVSPVIIQDTLFVGIQANSPKRLDLCRDGRYVLHMLPGPQDTEFSICGRAVQVNQASRLALIATSDGRFVVPETSVLFELDIEQIYSTSYEGSDPQTFRPIHRCWRASNHMTTCGLKEMLITEPS